MGFAVLPPVVLPSVVLLALFFRVCEGSRVSLMPSFCVVNKTYSLSTPGPRGVAVDVLEHGSNHNVVMRASEGEVVLRQHYVVLDRIVF